MKCVYYDKCIYRNKNCFNREYIINCKEKKEINLNKKMFHTLMRGEHLNLLKIKYNF